VPPAARKRVVALSCQKLLVKSSLIRLPGPYPSRMRLSIRVEAVKSQFEATTCRTPQWAQGGDGCPNRSLAAESGTCPGAISRRDAARPGALLTAEQASLADEQADEHNEGAHCASTIERVWFVAWTSPHPAIVTAGCSAFALRHH